ncbi:MAG: dihydrolipoyl dehydrogenase [Alphaproteobacteria bacterium]|nr:dihydrolipoyl dehydrogenase [Alphaproteobacteria bacterium]
MAESYDVVVIGGGPGGYVAAIRAAQLGLKVACVERRPTLGGTCLNVGCIPSKELLHSSHLFEQAAHDLAAHGIATGKVTCDLDVLLARKDKVVGDLTKGIEFLFRKNKVDHVKGTGRIAEPGTVAVTLPGGKGAEQMLAAKAIVIATGSEVARVPGLDVDEVRIVSSTGALALKSVPKHLVVVGGGYIGLEMGTVWRRLGAEVTVIEFLDSILANLDGEVARHMHRLLQRKGFTFKLGTKVTQAKATNKGVTLTLEAAKGGAAETMSADVVLVAVGRKPYTEGLGLAELGVALDAGGRVVVDGHFQTNVPGIHAIGDAIAGPMLAHKAEEDGVAVAEILAGKPGHVNYDTVPAVVYTWPEIATVGRTEQELKAAGIAYKTGKFPFSANSRARCMGETEGFVKILADAANDQVLGVHIIGPDAGHLIAEAALAMEYGASSEDIARTCHAHPTLSEALKEAALAVEGRAIHA